MTADKRTYWHLADAKRKPSEYEIVTSRLFFHKHREFDVRLPMAGWYKKYGERSPLVLEDWEQFRDPRETTYTRYTELQQAKEVYVDGLLRSMTERPHVNPAWDEHVAQIIDPLRFPIHGLQMIAAYVGQMAPNGRIAICCLCQTADEMRRVQRLAYRLALLRQEQPELGARGKAAWQTDPMWQPLRKLIEQLLVTYDWGEALIALNMCVKPIFDEIFGTQLATLCRGNRDELFATMLASLGEDSQWHREWTAALMTLLLGGGATNRYAIETWMRRWDGEVLEAMKALAPLFEAAPHPMSFTTSWENARDTLLRQRAALGLAELAA